MQEVKQYIAAGDAESVRRLEQIIAASAARDTQSLETRYKHDALIDRFDKFLRDREKDWAEQKEMNTRMWKELKNPDCLCKQPGLEQRVSVLETDPPLVTRVTVLEEQVKSGRAWVMGAGLCAVAALAKVLWEMIFHGPK